MQIEYSEVHASFVVSRFYDQSVIGVIWVVTWVSKRSYFYTFTNQLSCVMIFFSIDRSVSLINKNKSIDEKTQIPLHDIKKVLIILFCSLFGNNSFDLWKYLPCQYSLNPLLVTLESEINDTRNCLPSAIMLLIWLRHPWHSTIVLQHGTSSTFSICVYIEDIQCFDVEYWMLSFVRKD